MIEVVIENIRPARPHRFIFVVLYEHLESTELWDVLTAAAPGCAVVALPETTQGPACTVLASKAIINSRHPLMIANTDGSTWIWRAICRSWKKDVPAA